MNTDHTIASLLVSAGLLWGGPTLAQDGMSEPAAEQASSEQAASEPAAPIFTDAEFEQIAGMISGTWRSTAPTSAGDGQSSAVLMAAAPVRIEGMDNTLYAEFARADEPEAPYRVAIMQLHRVRGETRLRTFEFRENDSERYARALAGSFAFPEPRSIPVTQDELFATLDIPLRASGDGYTGRTAYPFPTNMGGAVEYKGSIEITPDRFFSAERGYDASGNIVWGNEPEAALEFERTDAYAAADARDTGLVIVTYGEGDGVSPQPGDYLVVHYIGSVMDGELFQSSIINGEAYRFEFPGRHISGWNSATQGIEVGMTRRVFIPSELAYGERALPNTPVVANSDLIFTIYPVAVEPADG